MIKYMKVPYHNTEKVFWNKHPFKIWVAERNDPENKGTRAEKSKAFRALSKVSGVARYTDQHSAMALYCNSVDDVMAALQELDKPNTRILGIYGPRDQDHLDLLLGNPSFRTRPLYHNRFEWQVRLRTNRNRQSDLEIIEWFKEMGNQIRSGRWDRPKTRRLEDCDYYLESTTSYDFRKKGRLYVAYAKGDAELMIMKLSLSEHFVGVNRAVPLENKNNKVGSHEPRPVPKDCRTETDDSRNANRD